MTRYEEIEAARRARGGWTPTGVPSPEETRRKDGHWYQARQHAVVRDLPDGKFEVVVDRLDFLTAEAKARAMGLRSMRLRGKAKVDVVNLTKKPKLPRAATRP